VTAGRSAPAQLTGIVHELEDQATRYLADVDDEEPPPPPVVEASEVSEDSDYEILPDIDDATTLTCRV